MTRLVKKLLIGASVVVGASTMGAIPSYAGTLTGIQFDTDDIEVFYADDAETALTDNDPLTNVELGASNENQTENIGFSGMLGGKVVSVETVTAADWAIFGTQWINDFTTAYSGLSGLENVIAGYIDSAMSNPNVETRFGDPNVGGFTFDENSGEYQLDLIGHYNLLNAPYLQSEEYSTMVNGLNFLLGGNPLQVSEMAKVTIDGVVNYAYSFSATDTGYDHADGSSHSGLYSWTLAGEPIQSAAIQSVPEPSTMLGLMAVGGLVTLSQRKSRNKV